MIGSSDVTLSVAAISSIKSVVDNPSRFLLPSAEQDWLALLLNPFKWLHSNRRPFNPRERYFRGFMAVLTEGQHSVSDPYKSTHSQNIYITSLSHNVLSARQTPGSVCVTHL